MYSKLFASILDSSIWLEEDSTRIVWLTFLAAKDGEGFARFAAIENLARRANVTIEKAQLAVEVLEAPDVRSSNPDHQGRRIERVPGGWMVLNAKLYDEMVRRDDERAATRERVRKHRERKAGAPAVAAEPMDDGFERAWSHYPKRGGGNSKKGAQTQWSARLRAGANIEDMAAGVERYAAYIRAKGDEGTEFVMQGERFFGKKEHWKEPWTPPAKRNGNSREAKVDAAVAAAFSGSDRGD